MFIPAWRGRDDTVAVIVPGLLLLGGYIHEQDATSLKAMDVTHVLQVGTQG